MALDAITGAPAFVGNRRLDILAANQLGYALYCDLYDNPARPANHARFIFFDERARSFYLNWEWAADETVAILHTGAGRDPYDRALTDLVRHPIVGELHLLFEAMELSADTGLSLYVYSASPAPPPTRRFASSRAGLQRTSSSLRQSLLAPPTGPEL